MHHYTVQSSNQHTLWKQSQIFQCLLLSPLGGGTKALRMFLRYIFYLIEAGVIPCGISPIKTIQIDPTSQQRGLCTTQNMVIFFCHVLLHCFLLLQHYFVSKLLCTACLRICFSLNKFHISLALHFKCLIPLSLCRLHFLI